MEDSSLPPPSNEEADASNCSPVGKLPPPPAVEIADGLDPTMTVMGGGEKEKASDYANCESFFFFLLYRK